MEIQVNKTKLNIFLPGRDVTQLMISASGAPEFLDILSRKDKCNNLSTKMGQYSVTVKRFAGFCITLTKAKELPTLLQHTQKQDGHATQQMCGCGRILNRLRPKLFINCTCGI